jgi:hydroxymethylbilane synthase
MNDAGPSPLRIGTRGSKLALHQTHSVESLLKAHHPDLVTEIVIIKTKGDRLPDADLVKISGVGIFTRELDRALKDGRIDAAVHSLKDLPTDLREGIELAAVPERETAQEAFLSNRYASFGELPSGALVGTGSPRRKAQLLAWRPDLEVKNLRGNVETRIKKMDEGEVDAIVLACAGLIRLEIEGRIRERLPLNQFVPAPGQGALGITVREGDRSAEQLLAPLNDPASAAEVEAERVFLRHLGGGCKTPIACHASLERDLLTVTGFVAAPDGGRVFQNSLTGPKASGEHLGRTLAETFLAQGARELLEQE